MPQIKANVNTFFGFRWYFLRNSIFKGVDNFIKIKYNIIMCNLALLSAKHK